MTSDEQALLSHTVNGHMYIRHVQYGCRQTYARSPDCKYKYCNENKVYSP